MVCFSLEVAALLVALGHTAPPASDAADARSVCASTRDPAALSFARVLVLLAEPRGLVVAVLQDAACQDFRFVARTCERAFLVLSADLLGDPACLEALAGCVVAEVTLKRN